MLLLQFQEDRLLCVACALDEDLVEHERSSSLLLEEAILRTASAGVTCGLGVRVVSGERNGYAYTDDLSFPAMARAAETAAHIASGSRAVPPQSVSSQPMVRRYGEEGLATLGPSTPGSTGLTPPGSEE